MQDCSSQPVGGASQNTTENPQGYRRSSSRENTVTYTGPSDIYRICCTQLSDPGSSQAATLDCATVSLTMLHLCEDGFSGVAAEKVCENQCGTGNMGGGTRSHSKV